MQDVPPILALLCPLVFGAAAGGIWVAARAGIAQALLARARATLAPGTGAPADQPLSEQTFLFADLVGFTALTEEQGDERAADVIGSFGARVRRLLPSHGAQEVKALGDGLMIRVRRPAEAVRLGLRIAREIGAGGLPPVRVGIHTGQALARGGDWFGGAVNVAARVTATAAGGEVLLTDATRSAVEGDGGIELWALGQRRLKNLSRPVELYRASWAAQAAPFVNGSSQPAVAGQDDHRGRLEVATGELAAA
jgi:adenylate cyclase